jgi:hypothetical protein
MSSPTKKRPRLEDHFESLSRDHQRMAATTITTITESGLSGLHVLPRVLQFGIIPYLQLKELLRLNSTSRALHQVVSNDAAWKCMFARHFPHYNPVPSFFARHRPLSMGQHFADLVHILTRPGLDEPLEWARCQPQRAYPSDDPVDDVFDVLPDVRRISFDLRPSPTLPVFNPDAEFHAGLPEDEIRYLHECALCNCLFVSSLTYDLSYCNHLVKVKGTLTVRKSCGL